MNDKLHLSEYPRPQLVRESYLSLNGYWEYAIRKDKGFPAQYDGSILVPYSPETPLSEVNRILHPDEYLFYRKKIELDDSFIKDKIILHFGAVDQVCEVFINNQKAHEHIGGFLPFEFDIKPYLKNNEVTITLRVVDVTDTSYLSRGKQKIKRGGIWYSLQSGIYMPVWLESVGGDYIKSLKITPNIDSKKVKIEVESDATQITLCFENKKYQLEHKCIELDIANMQLWTPDNPFLYNFEIETPDDKIKSYFAMRKFSLIKDEKGILRLGLNNMPFLFKGVLDQGYYHDGFLTPTSDDDYINDIKLIKALGFNTTRKHIKIESLRFYYHCDRLGLIVWQDMVSGGAKYNFLTISLPLISGIHRKDFHYEIFGRNNELGRRQTEEEMCETIKLLYNVPSLGLWTIFNEGWGQFDAKEIYVKLKLLDNTRLYDHASGWHDQGVSDVKSLHVYFKRVKMPHKKQIKNRSVILSECGGYSLPIKGHQFSEKTFGYKILKNKEDLVNEYQNFINKDIIKNIPLGLSAYIYTQLSDVEDEVNGFITYDRSVIKVKPDYIKAINDSVKL